MGTQVASKPGEPLELFKEDVKLSHEIAHHAFKKKARSHNTAINSQNDNSIVCRNRFEPLMELDLLLDDFDMLESEIQAMDTVPGDTGQTLKFDKTLIKKKVDPSVCRNRLEPLMELDLLLDDFNMLESEIQAMDTVPGDNGQIMKFDKN